MILRAIAEANERERTVFTTKKMKYPKQKISDTSPLGLTAVPSRGLIRLCSPVPWSMRKRKSKKGGDNQIAVLVGREKGGKSNIQPFFFLSVLLQGAGGSDGGD